MVALSMIAPPNATPAEMLVEAMWLADIGEIAEAEAACRRFLAEMPDEPVGRYLLGTIYLTQGRFLEGWPLYEARFGLGEIMGVSRMAPPACPPWCGEPLEGKRLLILPEQGFGDQIQFARYIPGLVAEAARVSAVMKQALAALLAPLGLQRPPGGFEDHDFHVYACSIPGIRQATEATIPAAPYLPAHQPISPTRRIGIAWQGSPTHKNDGCRSFPPSTYQPLAALNVELVPLDPALSGAQTFADTARIIDSLDAIVTVDTSVAHLAGAMGRPVYIALPFIRTDWRWMRDRSDSPWYPSARLYRQGPDLNWTPVIEAIRDDLARRYA